MSSNILLATDTSNGGFLSGLFESSVELPRDGKNGDCVVHYGGEHSEYKMKVKLVNGNREGEAVILNDCLPYLRVEYRNGMMTGVVERMNENEVVELRGHLLNGVENGFFEEYDENGNVVWRGYYKNGKRDSENTCRIVRKGKNDERSEWSGEFYELSENGQVKALCLYANGVKSRVVIEFNGSVMTEYDENGKKVYEGEFKGDVENGFVREGTGKEYRRIEGKVKSMPEPRVEIVKSRFCCWVRERKQEVPGVELVTKSVREEVVAGKWVNGEYLGVVVPSSLSSNPIEIEELEKKKREEERKRREEEERKRREEEERKRREEERKRREEEERKHREEERKRREEEERKRKYQIVVVPSSLSSNPMKIVELKIGDNEYNDDSVTEFKLSGLARLKRIVIGNGCFGKVRLFELDGLNELESIVIGEESFRIGDMELNDGSYRIVNCPKLKSIQIGYLSFQDYHSFEMSNLPSLQSIDFGYGCFFNAPSFSLIDLPQLQSIKLGHHAFFWCHSVVFENLPKLQSIQLDQWALWGDPRDDRKTIDEKPYNFKNTLTMKNLPSLTSFKGDQMNFTCIGSVILENIPQLPFDGIEFDGKGCFSYTYSLQSSSNLSLLSSLFDAVALELYIRILMS